MFTPEQYTRLLGLLNNEGGQKASAHMAGISSHTSEVNPNWIIDTGATNHMVGNSHLLVVGTEVGNTGKVQLPNGDSTDITHVGNSHLAGGDVLKDVLYVPTFKFNLLSVSKATKQLNCCISFYPDFCAFRDLSNGRVKMIGREQHGLYLVKEHKDNKNSITSQSLVAQELPNSNLWHRRMGHVPLPFLKKLPSISNTCSSILGQCDICPMARQTRLPFKHNLTTSVTCFELIHMDIWGPYKNTTYNSMNYFLTLVDDYFRWTWVFLLRVKCDVSSILKTFLAMILNQFEKHVKIFRTDNGSEFFNNTCGELFKTHGILHQSSCPYTPQQNGVVERRHRHLLETPRAIKFQGNLPSKFWGCCVEAVAYILNRVLLF